MDRIKSLKQTLANYKIPIIALAAGLLLLVFPSKDSDKAVSADAESELLVMVLSESSGIGEAKILISKNGVIVVCAGADDPAVRLNIIHAVKSYTGFGSDKITILKLE